MGQIKTDSKNKSEVITSQEWTFLQSILMGVVIVLFLGFISLVFALYGIYGQYTAFKDEATMQLQQSTKQLQQSVDQLNSSVKLLIPTITPKPTQ